MKSIVLYSLLFMTMFACVDSHNNLRGEKKSDEFINDRLQESNRRMIEAAKDKSFPAISDLYDRNALLMAEYNSLIGKRDNIKIYYDEIFDRQTIKEYTREVIDILIFENRVIEIGLFNKVLDNSDQYKGKYFNVWKFGKNQQLTLVAESFGYLHQIDNPSKLVVHEAKKSEPVPVNIPWELEAYMALNESNVMDRVPERSANAYTKDAMYLPFADTIKADKGTLLKHYQAYYANPAKIDSIQVFTYAYDSVADGYINYGGFYVDWSVPGFSGNTTGTGISYWRREADNSLRIHRQIGLHIHKE
jgi:hypothetical protein